MHTSTFHSICILGCWRAYSLFLVPCADHANIQPSTWEPVHESTGSKKLSTTHLLDIRTSMHLEIFYTLSFCHLIHCSSLLETFLNFYCVFNCNQALNIASEYCKTSICFDIMELKLLDFGVQIMQTIHAVPLPPETFLPTLSGLFLLNFQGPIQVTSPYKVFLSFCFLFLLTSAWNSPASNSHFF